MKKPLVRIDIREIKSGISNYLINLGCQTEESCLEIADYIVSDRVAIERKSFSDFVSSMRDLRLFSQLKKLSKFEKPVLLIEGFEYYGTLNDNSIFGAISSIILDFRIPIIWTKDKRDSAQLIYSLAKREQFKEKRGFSIRVAKKPKNLREEQEFLIAGLPSVNSILSKRLLEQFKSPKNIFTAKKEELLNVKNLGERKINRIMEVLEKETKSL